MHLFDGRRARGTHAEWTEYLLGSDRQMTREEFDSHELAASHALLEDIHAGLGLRELHENGSGGYFEQLRNLLDLFIKRLVQKPAATPQRPAVMTRQQHAEIRLLPRDGQDDDGREGV